MTGLRPSNTGIYGNLNRFRGVNGTEVASDNEDFLAKWTTT
jgi:hypothetical protein